MTVSFDAQISTLALVLGFAVAGMMFWLEKRPRQDLRPRLFPTTLVMLLGLLLALSAGVHLFSLGGFSPPQR